MSKEKFGMRTVFIKLSLTFSRKHSVRLLFHRRSLAIIQTTLFKQEFVRTTIKIQINKIFQVWKSSRVSKVRETTSTFFVYCLARDFSFVLLQGAMQD